MFGAIVSNSGHACHGHVYILSSHSQALPSLERSRQKEWSAKALFPSQGGWGWGINKHPDRLSSPSLDLSRSDPVTLRPREWVKYEIRLEVQGPLPDDKLRLMPLAYPQTV